MSDASETFPLEPELEFAFAAKVRVDPPMILAEESGIQKRVVPILGGPVEGPRLQGQVLSFGADWQAVRPDGTTEVLARYIIQAADGAMISVVNQGIRRASPQVIRRLLAGELVEPSHVYFRAVPTFEAPPGPHRWLSENVFVTAGQRRPDSVEIRFYVVR